MELTELAAADGTPEEVLNSRPGPFLAKLSMVDSLIVNLDREGCRALLEQMEARARPGEPLVEMKALRSLSITGGLKQWQQLESAVMRLLQLLRPVVLEELALIGAEKMKVFRTLLASSELHKTLLHLKVGLNGFNFLAQEDVMTMGARFWDLRSFYLFDVSTTGVTWRESACRMFICGGSFLENLGHIRAPGQLEVLHITNAGILGDDTQVASILRSLACFSRLRVLKLPLPSLPLTLREVLSVRLALPRLLFFMAEIDGVEGADEWPEGEDWPLMTEIWPLCETVTPMSVFAREFPEHLAGPGQAAEEWARLPEQEQHYYVEVTPLICQAYRQWERSSSSAGPPQELPADTSSGEAGSGDAARAWRAEPAPRALTSGECTMLGTDCEVAFDAQPASTHTLQDWQAEERSALRGVLAMKPSDICKDKARVRRECRPHRANEGLELFVASDSGGGGSRVARAEEEDLDSLEEDAQELYADHPQRCCSREQVGAELGDDSATAEL